LTRYFQAEQSCDRGGTSIKLEREAWRAVEMMLVDAHAGLNRLFTEAERLKPAHGGTR
jgi:hypothetical protein